MGLQRIIEERLEKSERLDRFLDKKVDEYVQKKCFQVLRLEQCIDWGRKLQKKNPKVSKIIIGVEENGQPYGQNDTLQITIAALDSGNRAIRKKGEEALAEVLFSETIDKEMIDFLDGADKKIYQL